MVSVVFVTGYALMAASHNLTMFFIGRVLTGTKKKNKLQEHAKVDINSFFCRNLCWWCEFSGADLCGRNQ